MLDEILRSKDGLTNNIIIKEDLLKDIFDKYNEYRKKS